MGALGKFSTRKNYCSTRRSFSTFLNGRKLLIGELDASEVERYNAFLDDRHVSENSKSFYNRNLRAIYNKAVRDGYAIPKTNMFAKVYTGIDKTKKKALPVGVLRKILSLDFSSERDLSLSRDIFVFSLFSQGMCFVDLARLSRRNIRGDELYYTRKKTGQRITVQMKPMMTEILNRYSEMTFGEYLFPVLHTTRREDAYREYSNKLNRYNLCVTVHFSALPFA